MKFSLCLLIGVVLFSLLALSAVPASAAIGQTMAIQGRLTNSTGGLQSGTFNFSYAIWDASAGGNELWWQNNTNETDDVSGDCIGIFQTVQDGIFNQYLGSTLGCPLNISFDAEYWLELTVNDSVLAPRHRISSAAYTFRANITDYIGPSTGAGTVNMNTQNITNIGYVGIGIATPGAKLETYDNGGPAIPFFYAIGEGIDPSTRDYYRWNSTYGPNSGGIRAGGSWGWDSQLYSDQELSFAAGGFSGASPDMVILTTGKVGIGTTTPLEKLHVSKAGDTATTGIIRAIMPDLATDGREVNIALGKSLAAGGTALWGYRYDTTPGDEGMYFTMYGDSANSLFIRKGGNVGIGTTTPASVLQVGGTLNAASSLTSTLALVSNTQQAGIVFASYIADTSSTQNVGGIFAEAGSGWTSKLHFNVSAGWANPTVEAMTISGSKVGINTSTPTQTLTVVGDLNVTGASYFGSQSFTNIDASGNLIVGKNLTVGGNNLFVDNSTGKVGIGTTSPSSKLYINDSTSPGASPTVGTYVLTVANEAGWGSPAILFKGSTARNVASLEVLDSGGDAGNIAFKTAIGGGALAEKVRILNNGYVGIGTASPTSLLQVVPAGANLDANVTIGTTVAGTGNGDLMVKSISGDVTLGLRADYNSQFSYIYSSDYAGTSSHPLILTGTKTRSAAISQFWVDANNLVLGGIGSGNLIVNGTTNIYGETYLATKTGKVGIGTTSPGRRLSVNGTINISGPAEAKWTSNDWEKRIEIPNGGVIIWYKGAGTVARAMGQFSDGKFYIGRSTVDEGAGTLYVDMVINGSGYIGIGTSNPQTTLEVSSVIRSTPTDAPIACGAATEGGIYYDNSLNEFCDCNGTTPWWQIDNGGAC